MRVPRIGGKVGSWLLLALANIVLSDVRGQEIIVINSTSCGPVCAVSAGDGVTATWGGWSEWSVQGPCSAVCEFNTGERSRQRTRRCLAGCGADNVQAQYYQCSGTQAPENGAYGQWSEWTDDAACNTLCGPGFISQTRNRSCDSPSPSCGGSSCIRTGPSEQRRRTACNRANCGNSCSRYSRPSVLREGTARGWYRLCYRGSVYPRPCPRAGQFRAYFVFGFFNAVTMYRQCN